MRPIVSALLGLAVVVVILTAFGRPPTAHEPRSSEPSPDASLETEASPSRGTTIRSTEREHRRALRQPVKKAREEKLAAHNVAIGGAPLPCEQSGLAPIFEYWAAEPVDPVTTDSEQSRIREKLTKHDVQPTSMKVTCTPKMCRSHMTFPDMQAAFRLHNLERRSDRRYYWDADPGSNEFRVAVYWTMTDEATAEAPDLLPESVDPPTASESAEPEIIGG